MTYTRLTKKGNATRLLWISANTSDSIHRRQHSSEAKKSAKSIIWLLSQMAQMRKRCKAWGIGNDMVSTSNFGRFAFMLETTGCFTWNFLTCLLKVAKSAKIRQAYSCSIQTVDINQTLKNICWKKNAR